MLSHIVTILTLTFLQVGVLNSKHFFQRQINEGASFIGKYIEKSTFSGSVQIVLTRSRFS